MKKISLVSLFLVLCPVMSFGGTCSPLTDRVTNGDDFFTPDGANGLGFECNTFSHGSCDSGTIVVTAARSGIISARKCSTGWNDKWDVIELSDVQEIKDCVSNSKPDYVNIIGEKGDYLYKTYVDVQEIKGSGINYVTGTNLGFICKEKINKQQKEDKKTQSGLCNDIETFFPGFFESAKNETIYKELLACCQNTSFMVVRNRDWSWNTEPINGKCTCNSGTWANRDGKWGCWNQDNPKNVVVPGINPGDRCNVLPHDTNLAGQCDNKNCGDICTQKNGHETQAHCYSVLRTSNSKPELTCAAEICQPGYSLWYSIPTEGKDYALYGICKKKSELEEFCLERCGDCNSDEKCLPDYFATEFSPDDPQSGFKDCKCKKTEQDDKDVTPDDEPTDCFFEFSGEIECENGNHYSGIQKMPIPKRLLKGATCEVYKKKYNNVNDLFDYLYKQNVKEVMDWYEKLCSGNGGSGTGSRPTGPSQEQITSATNSINTFFNSVKEDRSVWKTVDGKFNTARLASDLTAGVVLGTVGGVVSGVVIKKKQIEKGFEVLHCTVGGQKMADWGDEFTVRFIR